MDTRNDVPQSSRSKSLAIVVLASCVFVLAVVAINVAVKTLFGVAMASSVRARTTIELTGAMAGEIIVLILLLLHLRRSGVQLRQIGLWAPSPVRGWIAATAVATLFIWFNLALPLHDQPSLAELSLFRIYNSVLSAGRSGDSASANDESTNLYPEFLRQSPGPPSIRGPKRQPFGRGDTRHSPSSH